MIQCLWLWEVLERLRLRKGIFFCDSFCGCTYQSKGTVKASESFVLHVLFDRCTSMHWGRAPTTRCNILNTIRCGFSKFSRYGRRNLRVFGYPSVSLKATPRPFLHHSLHLVRLYCTTESCKILEGWHFGNSLYRQQSSEASNWEWESGGKEAANRFCKVLEKCGKRLLSTSRWYQNSIWSCLHSMTLTEHVWKIFRLYTILVALLMLQLIIS